LNRQAAKNAKAEEVDLGCGVYRKGAEGAKAWEVEGEILNRR
jgi:hypothetical protein